MIGIQNVYKKVKYFYVIQIKRTIFIYFVIYLSLGLFGYYFRFQLVIQVRGLLRLCNCQNKQLRFTTVLEQLFKIACVKYYSCIIIFPHFPSHFLTWVFHELYIKKKIVQVRQTNSIIHYH